MSLSAILCVPQILIHCIFILIQFNVFFSLETSSLTYVLFGSMLFSFQVFIDFFFSCSLSVDYIGSGNHNLYNFSSFQFVDFVCFFFCFCPECVSALYILHGHLKRMYVLL